MSFQSWLGSVNLHLIRHRNKTGRGRRPRYCGSERAFVAIESLEDRSLLSSTAVAADPVFLATGGFTFAATEGTLSANQTVATFTGPGGAEAVASYTATILWGDGSPSSPGTIRFSGDVFIVSGSHRYAEDGSYNVVTTISDTRTSGIPHRSTLNFDTVDASASPVNASSYLASFGITLSAVTAGTAIDVVNNQSLYGGTAARPSSSPNMLTQFGSKNPVTYTLNFATPVDSFGFTRPMLLAGPSRIIHPRWSAHAFNAAGHEVALASESLLASAPSIPARTFSLTGNGITSVRIDSNAFNLAAISAVLIDDLTFTTKTAISVSATSLGQVSVANHPPTAFDDEVTTDESQVITFDVLANDTDDEQNLAASRTTNLTLPAKGVLTDLGDGTFAFDPSGEFESLGAGQSETVEFTYQIKDLFGETDTAVVTIEIHGINDAPIANGTLADVIVNQNAANTVVSLGGKFSDVDASDSLTLTAVSSSNGLVIASVSQASLMLDYQPNQSGSARITVTATDGSGMSVSITFTVQVLSPQKQSQTIVNQITQWQTDGRINQGTVCSMISKMDNALKGYNKGNIKAAENKLNALKNEIKAKTKPGSLTQADAALAIRLIDALIVSLRP